ncbi:MAG: hypothetical protein K6U03_02240 [Firmicutes bacterium]|nr:hypothetical protein [Bacillota bacterium]
MGFLVSLLEFPCTGQVYFPVVAVIREEGGPRLAAFGHLLLYDLLFIAPLFGLIVLLRLGTTSAHLAGMARGRGWPSSSWVSSSSLWRGSSFGLTPSVEPEWSIAGDVRFGHGSALLGIQPVFEEAVETPS